MLNALLNSFKEPELRNKLLFTFAMLALYRLGVYIPAPGVSASAVNSIQKNLGGNNIFGLLNLFSGGGLGRIALFALGIMPYITASIILQLLTVVVPALEKLQKEGEVGQARITQYTRYLTVGLAFAQSIGYVFLFKSLESSANVTLIPAGAEVRIEAKMSSEMPLPIPRFVISSPIHMSSTVPAVSEITMRKTCGVSKLGMTGVPALGAKLRKRKT